MQDFGFLFKNFSTGELLRHKAGKRWPAASLIKIFIALETFQRVEENKLNWNQKLTLDSSN